MNRLDHCGVHGEGECDCPAWLVALGCMDRLTEERIERDPGVATAITARLRERSDE